ncbi:MAG: Lrp/AsnC family transcriptional regulator [Desulfotomaculum sp.]|nr:Lrp/AsnC family transcriptional regulator [Desulfotomaculum sp.]MCL0081525.1 Lrp/AsnC family transcriptional regulator [Peptococcaceae bacterium]
MGNNNNDKTDQSILELLEQNCRLTSGEIAALLDLEEMIIQQRIVAMEQKGIICTYQAMVNWEKTATEKVNALIEVKITPQREVGFDAVAERIYRFPEVHSVLLMSGDYDLAVFLEGKNMKDVAQFVSSKLATMEHVLSTATHFVLKTYKKHGCIMEDGETDRRLVITP